MQSDHGYHVNKRIWEYEYCICNFFPLNYTKLKIWILFWLFKLNYTKIKSNNCDIYRKGKVKLECCVVWKVEHYLFLQL